MIARMTFWVAPLNALFDSLCEGGPPREAEAIFVFAGRPERKPYGVELWRQGYAPILVLSVARFEWRRYVELGLPDGGLVDLVQRTRPEERHFFVVLDRAGRARAFRVSTGRLGTWSEAWALAEYLERERIHSVLVVSSASHLRRAATTLRAMTRFRADPGEGIRIDATAVPEHESSILRDGWWRSARPRRAVLREAVKLFLYRIRLGFMALAGR
jgi:hypothetical protein